MVAKIVIGSSIRGILHYNENKVAEGRAKLILANGFAGEIDRMDIFQKYQRFKYLNELRPTVKTNALHITLNFDSAEKIDHSKMQQIAMNYMEGLGFGDQPYLVYRHSDAGHQHIHIATTSIQRNGEPIGLNNIAIDRSEPIRKRIEHDFNLIVAEKKERYKQQPVLKAVEVEKVDYGHLPTKRAISNVLSAVAKTYTYTSLAELNAVLKQFNVIAERGKEDSEMFKNKGLIYFMLDKKGNKVGVPIKASSFYSKPTLRNIEKRYGKNTEKRKAFRVDLTRRIDRVLLNFEQLTKATLTSELEKSGIALVFRQNDNGLIYGITFVDHWKKTVFNGSDLGKDYGAKALVERLGNVDQAKTYLKTPTPSTSYLKLLAENDQYLKPVQETGFLETLLDDVNENYTSMPKNYRKKKRKSKHIQQDQGPTL